MGAIHSDGTEVYWQWFYEDGSTTLPKHGYYASGSTLFLNWDENVGKWRFGFHVDGSGVSYTYGDFVWDEEQQRWEFVPDNPPSWWPPYSYPVIPSA